MNKFTQAQIDDIYQHIVAQDAEFVSMMARAAITNSADVRCDMWADQDEGTPVPDKASVREMAQSFTEDMFADFGHSFKEALKTTEFELRLRLKHHVGATFK